ncbi:MAG: thiamine pyrophosphate-binding protein, partial [Pseudonocardia sp.]|nr:thiamine pyrophosphate-binding protein [Pseudonocardia sp.]
LAHLGSGRGFIHETKDQLGMLTAVSAAAHTITEVGGAEAVLRTAVREALSGGPVSVEWPIDLQYAPHPVVSGKHGYSHVFHSRPPEPDVVSEAAALLAQSQRPLIWAGGGVAAAGEPLRRLVERLGAGLLTSNSGRGAVPEDHPLCVGNYATSPAGQELLDEADLLLSIGTHFRSNETRDYRLRLPGTHIQVDRDPAAPGRAYPVKLGVVADAAAFLDALLDRVPTRDNPDWRERVAAARSAARARHREGLGAHAELADAVREALPARSPIVRDITIASSAWGNRLLPIYDPRDNVFPRSGGIGQGLGMGIGAALARPDVPTLVMAGDGGLAVHLGELLTLAQERPWLVLLVFNDRGYGVLRNMQDAGGGPRAGVDLATPEFAGLAAAVGLPYVRIDRAVEARPVLRDAVARRGPVLVEVDLAAYGPMPAPFTPPVNVPGRSPS